jgi:hypothetical protein
VADVYVPLPDRLVQEACGRPRCSRRWKCAAYLSRFASPWTGRTLCVVSVG